MTATTQLIVKEYFMLQAKLKYVHEKIGTPMSEKDMQRYRFMFNEAQQKQRKLRHFLLTKRRVMFEYIPAYVEVVELDK